MKDVTSAACMEGWMDEWICRVRSGQVRWYVIRDVCYVMCDMWCVMWYMMQWYAMYVEIIRKVIWVCKCSMVQLCHLFMPIQSGNHVKLLGLGVPYSLNPEWKYQPLDFRVFFSICGQPPLNAWGNAAILEGCCSKYSGWRLIVRITGSIQQEISEDWSNANWQTWNTWTQE